MEHEVSCPACGALIEAESVDEVVELCRAHTLDAHAYDIPRDHVLTALANSGDAE